MEDCLPSGVEVLDGYRLIRFLGRGGFGEVWLCRSEAMGDYRALKWIPAGLADRMQKEYDSLLLYRNAAAKLRSPNLVPIEHINRVAAGLYYVMPLADGMTDVEPADPAWRPMSLAAVLQKRSTLPKWFSADGVCTVLHPILEALQTLSEAGLVHRDVKPDNILFFHGAPSLGDISLLGEDASLITRRGTPGYATPSWYVGGHPDMYGAAATLYALLTGNPPDMMGRAAFLWPPQGEASLSEAERLEWKRLHGVIRRATEEKVGERYVDFRTMATAVVAAGAPVMPPQPPAMPASTTILPERKSKLPLASAALLVIAIAGVILANRSGSKQPPTAPATSPIAAAPSAPNATSGRKPKIVDARGDFKSLRERVIEVIPAAITVAPADDEPRLDLGDYGDRSAILKSYQARDYSRCLDLLNARINNKPPLLKNPLCILFRAVLFKQLNRESEEQAALKHFRQLTSDHGNAPKSDNNDLGMLLTLLEALDQHREAEAHASAAIEAARAELSRDGPQARREDVCAVMMLYRDRARTRILQGDMAGALADEEAALKLPSGMNPGGSVETAEEAQQIHLNTIVMEWELLEQEFPAYADYLEANGSPEPKPVHRDLRAVD